MNLDDLDAPQFVDFTQLNPDDDLNDEDNYFDFDHESEGNTFASSINDLTGDGNDSCYSDAKENNTSEVEEPVKKPTDGKKPKILSNICTSLDDWKKKCKSIASVKTNEGARRSPRTAAVAKAGAERKMKKKVQQDESKITKASASDAKRNLSSSAVEVPIKRSRTRSADRSLQSLPGAKLTRANSLRSSARRSESKEVDRANSLRSSTRRSESRDVDHRLKLTKPKTPECLKREVKSSQSSKLKSTTEMELQEVEQYKKALAQNRKQHEQYRLKAMKAAALAPKLTGKAPTKPEEFHFKTDTRVNKNHSMETRQDVSDKKDFTGTLRSQQHLSPRTTPQKTKVRPFSFDRKRKRPSEGGSTEAGSYHSMAEMVKKFSSKTPERFRQRGNNREPSPSKRRRRSMSQPHLTLPKTPNLQTRNRSRPVAVKSHEEIVEEEVEEHKKQQFKAHPVNEKILDKVVGVKRVTPKSLTQPMTPQLELRRRAAAWQEQHKKLEDSPKDFHANPVPKAVLEGPVGVKPPSRIPLTVPSSPAFATRNRVANIIKQNDSEVEQEENPLRTRPAPKFGVPFKPKLETRVTEPKPFSFEGRMKNSLQKKEEKIQRLAEELNSAKEFHANPIPDLSPELPEKVVKPATVPKPFNLELNVRGQARAEEWSHKIKEELKSARDQACFKAKPSTILQKEPFIPKKSNKPLTDVSDVQLNTERRLEDRHQWEKWRQEKEQEQCEIEKQRQQMKEQEEKEQEKLLRKQLVTKAKPIRKYKDIAIKSSDRPLTQPNSPHFSERPARRSMRC